VVVDDFPDFVNDVLALRNSNIDDLEFLKINGDTGQKSLKCSVSLLTKNSDLFSASGYFHTFESL